ncbi:MAG TPA: HAD family hydrolase [Solirubrobacteraceae bacterium]|nr:HAD family hydrolase [Solirubrobacteraceae bacterium]
MLAQTRHPRSGEHPAAVLLDALGTLVCLDRPFQRLADELARRGAPVGLDAAMRALGEEMRFYRAHHDRAVDRLALEALRDDCARVLRTALPPAAAALGHEEVRAALLGALRFEAFPEVAGVLGDLRAGGHPIVVVSNWDVSLHDVLGATGLAPLVDATITSAEEGVAKPAPELFHRALARIGRDPHQAVHAGDDVEADVAGAAGAGIAAVLVDREGGLEAPPGVPRVTSLAALPPLVRGRGTGGP